MDKKELHEFIKSRKTTRHFLFEKIRQDVITEILECGRWAPSGLNNQPWYVCAVSHPTVKRMLVELTKSGGIIESSFISLVIFLDLEKGYDRVKDIQAVGAFMQNILLAVHAIEGLGACWIGEILNQKEKVNEIFKFSTDKYELMGVIAIGPIDEQMEKQKAEERERRPVKDFVEWF